MAERATEILKQRLYLPSFLQDHATQLRPLFCRRQDLRCQTYMASGPCNSSTYPMWLLNECPGLPSKHLILLNRLQVPIYLPRLLLTVHQDPFWDSTIIEQKHTC